MAAVVAGIDVSKDQLDVHVRPDNQVFAVPRDEAGLDELVGRLRQLEPVLIALEASGGFEQVVAAALATAALPVVVVNPAQVRSFAHALGRRAKTDRIDAAVIAHFAEATSPDVRPLPDEATQMLAALMTRRRQIVQMLTAERQRLRTLAAPGLQKSLQRLIKALQQELHALDREIGDAMRGTPLWREKENLLRSVPGIGPVIARTLIAEMPELGTLTRKTVASLAGLAPFTRESGRWRGKSFIGGGRAAVRAALYPGAMAAIRCNPPLRAFYLALVERGKPKQQALVAVARKLLTIANAVIRDRRPWEVPA
jgi:transposase